SPAGPGSTSARRSGSCSVACSSRCGNVCAVTTPPPASMLPEAARLTAWPEPGTWRSSGPDQPSRPRRRRRHGLRTARHELPRYPADGPGLDRALLRIALLALQETLPLLAAAT